MQSHGFIIDERTGEQIRILIRIGKRIDKFSHVIDLKIRKAQNRGQYFKDESDYLNQNPELIDKLKKGEVIYC